MASMVVASTSVARSFKPQMLRPDSQLVEHELEVAWGSMVRSISAAQALSKDAWLSEIFKDCTVCRCL